jgi:hypothetical protein
MQTHHAAPSAGMSRRNVVSVRVHATSPNAGFRNPARVLLKTIGRCSADCSRRNREVRESYSMDRQPLDRQRPSRLDRRLGMPLCLVALRRVRALEDHHRLLLHRQSDHHRLQNDHPRLPSEHRCVPSGPRNRFRHAASLCGRVGIRWVYCKSGMLDALHPSHAGREHRARDAEHRSPWIQRWTRRVEQMKIYRVS